ncbi:MAG: NAD(P)/FAD-dependent oxidoreductase [Segniliparus sp.]|uniref:NAD(P)/FAD-dependent oxidoreductase n=1 Tax=Segniliparus sp. TaxID=2804064 RepID=UPI003F2A6330
MGVNTQRDHASPRRRVVIIGSGFGGLAAAKHLRHADVDVTLISKTTHHLFQPMLYQVATGIIAEGEIAPTTRVVLAEQRNATVLVGEVVEIDLAAQKVRSHFLGRTTTTGFDSLVVAAGAEQSYFGNDQFAEFAPGMKTIDDALEIRARILGAFEQAELSEDPQEIEKLLTFVVVGGGPTGVELAGQIAEMVRGTLKGAYRRVDPAVARVVLVDGSASLLQAFGQSLGEKAARRLEELGVQLLLNRRVVHVDADSVTVHAKDGTDEVLPSFCKVWSAGVAASPLGGQLAEQSGVKLDHSGRVEVGPDLSLPGHPDVFVVGDMMAVPGVCGVAQGAIQGGAYAAKAIKAGLAGADPASRKPFRYWDKGSMAAVSRFYAVVKVGKVEFGGLLAWLAWLGLHLVYLVGYRNRVATLWEWAVTFFSERRGQLVVTVQQGVARTELKNLRHKLAELEKAAAPPTA